MSTNSDEVLEVLREIRDIVSRIYVCFEDEYLTAQERKTGQRLQTLRDMLTDERKKVFPLLFDIPRLTQTEIARQAGITQSNVSKFIRALIDQELIEQIRHQDGSVTYRDKYDLVRLLQD